MHGNQHFETGETPFQPTIHDFRYEIRAYFTGISSNWRIRWPLLNDQMSRFFFDLLLIQGGEAYLIAE